MSSIHTNIRVLREEARLSQEEFAEQLNVDVQTVKLWEKGKIDPSDDEITKMCPILRIHKEDFLERDILAERTNANSKMKRGQHRSNYDWYYGNRLNMAFYDYAQTHNNFYICDVNYISASYGLDKWSDPYYWYMYKYAVAVPAFPYLSFNVAKVIKSIYGKNKKAFNLDLENTL